MGVKPSQKVAIGGRAREPKVAESAIALEPLKWRFPDALGAPRARVAALSGVVTSTETVGVQVPGGRSHIAGLRAQTTKKWEEGDIKSKPL